MSSTDAAAERGSGGEVVILYYENDRHEGFQSDTLAALKLAAIDSDAMSVQRIWDLWQVYLESGLRSIGLRRLVDWLEGQRVWRRHDLWPVFKTAGTPCLAFTATVDIKDEKVTLVALAMCYRYPSDDEGLWWRNVVLPRVRSL